MPRDATGTRERLLEAAERLFASRGVHQATSREIIEAAGQRNVSALTYHFGSREGVLWAILRRHNARVDAKRAELVREPLRDMATRDLVGALLVPYASELGAPDGRDHLRIIVQLTDTFADWHGAPLSPPVLVRILTELERRVPGEPAVRRARVVHVVSLMTTAFAERARLVEEGLPVELAEDAFLANLADMMVGGLEAPVGPPLGRIVAAI